MRAIEQNIAAFPTSKPRKSHQKRSAPRTAAKAWKRQQTAAIAVAAVTAVLMALSLAHLAHGIALVSGAPMVEAWMLGIGVDAGFVACELAPLCAHSTKARAAVIRYARPTVAGTVLISAALNAMAFGSQAEGLMVYPAAGLGLAVPAMIYSLSRIAFGLAMSK